MLDDESDANELTVEWVSDQDGLMEDDSSVSSDGEVSYTTAAIGGTAYRDPEGRSRGGWFDYMTVRIATDCLALSNCDYDEDGYTEEQGDCDDNDDDRSPDTDEI